MTDVQDQTSWENCYRLLHQFCHEYMKKAQRSGLNVDYDDLFQEASLAYLNAKQTFDPTRGFRFITYMGTCACNQLGRFLGGEFNRRRHQVSLAPETDETQEEQLERMGASECDSIEEDIDFEKLRHRIRLRLSPPARRVLDILESPPPEIVEELRATQAKARIARAQGRAVKSHKAVNFAFLARHILPITHNMSRAKIYQIRTELTSVATI